jgi:hypothetical protein
MFIRLLTIFLAALYLTIGGFSAQAGERNVISLTQRGSHNTIVIDQSHAFDSRVTGPYGTALQSGTGHRADLNLTGDGGHISLQQGGLLSHAHNNQTQIAINAHHASALIEQIGNSNYAGINVQGQHASASVLQSSNQNSAQINVLGGHARGSIEQTQGGGNQGRLDVVNGTAKLVQSGSGNDTQLQVSATGAGHVTYILQADHTVQAAGPLIIDHSGPSITIIQTQ